MSLCSCLAVNFIGKNCGLVDTNYNTENITLENWTVVYDIYFTVLKKHTQRVHSPRRFLCPWQSCGKTFKRGDL